MLIARINGPLKNFFRRRLSMAN